MKFDEIWQGHWTDVIESVFSRRIHMIVREAFHQGLHEPFSFHWLNFHYSQQLLVEETVDVLAAYASNITSARGLSEVTMFLFDSRQIDRQTVEPHFP